MYFRLYGRHHVLYHGANGLESRTTLCLEEVRQVAVPAGHKTTTVFGRIHHRNAALVFNV